MSYWNYFLNTLSACSFAEENEVLTARVLVEEAERERMAAAAKLTPANLQFAAVALAEEGLWQDAITMDDEADRLLVSGAATPAWQRTFAAVAFAEEGEPGLAAELLDGGAAAVSEGFEVEDRRVELFLHGYVRSAGAVAFAEAGELEQALRYNEASPGRILVVADGGGMHERFRDYALRLAGKSGLELVVASIRKDALGRDTFAGKSTGPRLLLEEAQRRGISCRHFAASGARNRTIAKLCAELGGVAFVLTEGGRRDENTACGDVPVFTMAFLDEALGLPASA